jgi:hypothetical protein
MFSSVHPSLEIAPKIFVMCGFSTKYIYLQSTTVYVPSSELGLSHPLSRQRACPSLRTGGGGSFSPAGEGLGESQFQRLEKSLALCLLCGFQYDFFIFKDMIFRVTICTPGLLKRLTNSGLGSHRCSSVTVLKDFFNISK